MSGGGVVRKWIPVFHAGNPNLGRVSGLKVKSMPECEGGGYYVHADDARLIAAAPTMLEALRKIAGDGDGTGCNPQIMVDVALVAIAKAEGRS